MAAAWSKAVAAAATLIIAGAGTGAGTNGPEVTLGASTAHKPAAKPRTTLAAPRPAPARSRELAGRPSAGRAYRRSASLGRAPARGEATPRSEEPGRTGTRSSPVSSAPSSSSPAAEAPGGTSEATGERRPASVSSPIPSVEVPGAQVPLPDPTGLSPSQAGDAVNAVQETGTTVIKTAEDVVDGATGAVPQLGG